MTNPPLFPRCLLTFTHTLLIPVSWLLSNSSTYLKGSLFSFLNLNLKCPALTHLLQEGPYDCPGQAPLHLLLWSMAHVPRLWAETHSWQLLSKLKTHFCKLSRVMRLMCSNMSRRVLPSEIRRCHLAWTEKGTELGLP